MGARDLNAIAAARAVATTGNAALILHEIRHALDRLAHHGTPTTIDLNALPMTPADLALITDTLGRGEVRALIDASGPTEVLETAFSGVWLITHRGPDDMILGRFAEIAAVPALLAAQAPDIHAALIRLHHRLSHFTQQTGAP